MTLSDIDILSAKKAGRIKIKPFRKGSLRPSSYELHLGESAMFFNVNSQEESVIDLRLPVDEVLGFETITKEWGAFIPPGGLILASTEETVELDEAHAARLSGLGSVEAVGIMVNPRDEAVEPGMSTKIILAIQNVSPCSLKVYPGMPIAKLTFEELKSPSGLSGKGKGVNGPVSSEIHKSFKG